MAWVGRDAGARGQPAGVDRLLQMLPTEQESQESLPGRRQMKGPCLGNADQECLSNEEHRQKSQMP